MEIQKPTPFNMISRRNKRLSSLYREIVSSFLERELRVPGALMAVVNVEVADSLERVTIDVSVWPDEKEREVFQELGRLKKELRLHLAERVKIKFAPKITFVLDESEKKRIAIERLLKKTGQMLL